MIIEIIHKLKIQIFYKLILQMHFNLNHIIKNFKYNKIKIINNEKLNI